MLIIAPLVDAVATTHEYHRLGRSKHVLAAYWTVAIGGALDTAVRVAYGD